MGKSSKDSKKVKVTEEEAVVKKTESRKEKKPRKEKEAAAVPAVTEMVEEKKKKSDKKEKKEKKEKKDEKEVKSKKSKKEKKVSKPDSSDSDSDEEEHPSTVEPQVAPKVAAESSDSEQDSDRSAPKDNSDSDSEETADEKPAKKSKKRTTTEAAEESTDAADQHTKKSRVDSAAQEQDDMDVVSNVVFLNGLPFHIQESEITSLFGKCGTIKRIRWHMKDHGKAFVQFDSADAAAEATRMSGVEINGRYINIYDHRPSNWYNPSAVSVEGGTSEYEKQIREALGEFGDIQTVEFFGNNCLVVFSTPSEADACVAADIYIEGQEVRVKLATARWCYGLESNNREGGFEGGRGGRGGARGGGRGGRGAPRGRGGPRGRGRF